MPCLGFSPVIFEDRYRQSRNPFPRITGRRFHGGPRSISGSPIVDRERRFDAKNLLRGLQERRGKNKESCCWSH